MILRRHSTRPAAEVQGPLQDMELEGLIEGEQGVVCACAIPAGQIEAGRCVVRLPDGVVKLAGGAFDAYNRGSDVIRDVQERLYSNSRAIEIEKQLHQKRISPREYPPELKTIRERRDHILGKELRCRLLRLYLPTSLTCAEPGAFPTLLEAIEVPPDHPVFSSRDGVLFSKDGETLLRYPGLAESRDYTIPPQVKHIAPGAFQDAFLETLTIPGALSRLSEGDLANLHACRVVLEEGVETVGTGAFHDSCIRSLSLPGSLKRIEDEAFRGVQGLAELDYVGTGAVLGTALFRSAQMDDVSWWCWSQIPKGTFLNCALRRITIPEGVEDIGAYAFAGCYTAKSVHIAGSVQNISPYAFDLGPTYSHPVTLPEHLYQFICRLPARSPVNKRGKAVLLQRFEAEGCTENRDILERQFNALNSMPPLRQKMQVAVRKELAFYERQLSRCQEVV